jgi:hypothetical protein
MPAIAALTINDGLGAPVAHTYSPQTTDGSKALWKDRSPTIPAGYRTISHEVLEPAGNRTVNKLVLGFANPTVATIDGSDTVVRYQSGQVILNFTPDSTLQERKDTLAYMVNTLNNALIKASVENVEPFY